MTDNDSHDLMLDPLDRPIWGAKAIGKAAGLKGEREAYCHLEGGRIAARKVGNQWVSTPRQVRASVLPRIDDAAE